MNIPRAASRHPMVAENACRREGLLRSDVSDMLLRQHDFHPVARSNLMMKIMRFGSFWNDFLMVFFCDPPGQRFLGFLWSLPFLPGLYNSLHSFSQYLHTRSSKACTLPELLFFGPHHFANGAGHCNHFAKVPSQIAAKQEIQRGCRCWRKNQNIAAMKWVAIVSRAWQSENWTYNACQDRIGS